MKVVALEVALERKVEAVLLATLMPKQWSSFIRNAPQEEIKDLGLKDRRRLERQGGPPGLDRYGLLFPSEDRK